MADQEVSEELLALALPVPVAWIQRATEDELRSALIGLTGAYLRDRLQVLIEGMPGASLEDLRGHAYRAGALTSMDLEKDAARRLQDVVRGYGYEQ